MSPRSWLTQIRRVLGLLWAVRPRSTLALLALSVLAALIPTAAAWTGRAVVDSVASAATSPEPMVGLVLAWIAVEAALMVALALGEQVRGVLQHLVRGHLAHAVQVQILRKAERLDVADFERSTFYDRLVRAQREASSRPLYAASRILGVMQQSVSLASVALILCMFSPLAVVLLAVATVPSLLVEVTFSRAGFKLANLRAPESRERAYLATLMTREDFAREVKLLGIEGWILERHQQLFDKVFAEDRALAVRRGVWAGLLRIVTTTTLYGTLAWIAGTAATGRISIGEMTMYMLLFRQGQSALAGALMGLSGMYEDQLYLTNLFEFLDSPEAERGSVTEGTHPGDGVRFQGVVYQYPGRDAPALEVAELHLPPAHCIAVVGENGSGKSTLVKLMTGIYQPDRGTVRLDGVPTACWDPSTLRRRFSVMAQDYVRFQLSSRMNIGVGALEHLGDDDRLEAAASAAGAFPFLRDLPRGIDTRLGRWFDDGVELSGGQWQRVALARALFRREATFLVLDEPTAAMDPEAEGRIFEQLRRQEGHRGVVLVSHRLATVCQADEVVVLEGGRIVQRGAPGVLLEQEGPFTRLFARQMDDMRRGSGGRRGSHRMGAGSTTGPAPPGS